MKLNQPIVTRIISWPLLMLIRGWMRTLRYRIWYHAPAVDPVVAVGKPHIYLMWHEYTLLPLYLRASPNFSLLLSQHRDADILYRISKLAGMDPVRGSSFRGGSQALLKLTEVVKKKHLAITPDGPRGPRRRVAQGAIYLSSKLGVPIVCVGLAYHQPWRLRSWDRFAIPKPFRRASCVMSEAIQVPPDLDREGIEHWRQKVEQRMNELSAEAQDWADSGKRLDGCERIEAIDKHNRAA